MKDIQLLESVNIVLSHDLNSGIYNNFPKLKSQLEYVKVKLVKFMTITNSMPLTDFDAKLLLDNDVIDEGVYRELVSYYKYFR